MKITRTSMFTGIERTLDLDFTAEQLAEWKNGALIQDAMPNLSAADREFIMTGVTDEEWDEEFGDEETDSVHDLKGTGVPGGEEDPLGSPSSEVDPDSSGRV